MHVDFKRRLSAGRIKPTLFLSHFAVMLLCSMQTTRTPHTTHDTSTPWLPLVRSPHHDCSLYTIALARWVTTNDQQNAPISPHSCIAMRTHTPRPRPQFTFAPWSCRSSSLGSLRVPASCRRAHAPNTPIPLDASVFILGFLNGSYTFVNAACTTLRVPFLCCALACVLYLGDGLYAHTAYICTFNIIHASIYTEYTFDPCTIV